MARAEIPFAVLDSVTGAAVAGASIQVNIRGGGPATVFAAETGASTTANPLTTGAGGRIDGWLDEGSYNLQVSGGSITSYTQPIEVVRGDGVGRYAAGSITSTALATTLVQALLPAGAVLPFAGTGTPAGFLLAQGQTVNRTTFASLFAAIGTTYNTGGEAGTDFRLPDYQGRVLVGLGTHTDVNALTKNDGIVAAASRRVKHAHTRGTLAANTNVTGISTVSAGSHSHTGVTGSDFPDHTHSMLAEALGSNPYNVIEPSSGALVISGSNNSGGLTGLFAAPYAAPSAIGFGWGVGVGGRRNVHQHTINTDGGHTHTITDPQHTHTLSGAIGDTSLPTTDSPSYQVVNYIIKT